MNAPDRIWAQPGDDQSVEARLSWETGNCTTPHSDHGDEEWVEYIRADPLRNAAPEMLKALIQVRARMQNYRLDPGRECGHGCG